MLIQTARVHALQLVPAELPFSQATIHDHFWAGRVAAMRENNVNSMALQSDMTIVHPRFTLHYQANSNNNVSSGRADWMHVFNRNSG